MDFEDDVFEDAFDDDRYDDRVSDRDEKMSMEQLEHEQSLISRKSETNAFSVNRTFVNSIAYHHLYDELKTLQISKPVREGLYREAGRLLEFVDGQEYERMVQEVALMSDAKLEEAYYDSVYDSLGSQAETMEEQGWDPVDIKERRQYEKFLSERSDLLGFICRERGIELWNKEKQETKQESVE